MKKLISIIFTLLLGTSCAYAAAEPTFLVNWNASQAQVENWINFQTLYYKDSNIGGDWLADKEEIYIENLTVCREPEGYTGKAALISHYAVLFGKKADIMYDVFNDQLTCTQIMLLNETASNEIGMPDYNEYLQKIEAEIISKMDNPRFISTPTGDLAQGESGLIEFMDDITYACIAFSVNNSQNTFELDIILAPVEYLAYSMPEKAEKIKEAFGRN